MLLDHSIITLALFFAAPLVHAAALKTRLPGVTRTDVTDGLCRDVTLLFARGTNEEGNLGGSVGPRLAHALLAALPSSTSLAVQGIDYPADNRGAIQGSINPAGAAGSIDCEAKLISLLEYCPETKVVLSGYSQGAQQVHGCLMRITETMAQSVMAAVTFGDPLRDRPFDKIDPTDALVFCNEGDQVCENRPIITPEHLTYMYTAIDPAVEFIMTKPEPSTV